MRVEEEGRLRGDEGCAGDARDQVAFPQREARVEYAADDEACEIAGDALNLASAVVILARQSALTPQMLYTGLTERQSAATLERSLQSDRW